MASKQLDDPEAEEYAKQQKIQEKQDSAAEQREQEERDKKAKEAAKEIAKKEEEDALARRSEFNAKRGLGSSASQILNILGSLVLVSFMLYGGYIAANAAIGYKNPFRILSFLYGAILFFYVIPKSFIDTYYFEKVQHFYAFLPLSTHVPKGNLENVFLYPFCYVEDQFSIEARKTVETLYANALIASNSMKAASIIGSVAAVSLAAARPNTPKANEPPKTDEAPKNEAEPPKPVEVPKT